MSFQQAMQRPSNFEFLSAEEQWAIDKRLGILDWMEVARKSFALFA